MCHLVMSHLILCFRLYFVYSTIPLHLISWHYAQIVTYGYNIRHTFFMLIMIRKTSVPGVGCELWTQSVRFASYLKVLFLYFHCVTFRQVKERRPTDS